MKFGVYHAISIRAIEKPSLFGKRFTRIHRIHGWKFIEKDEFPHVLTSIYKEKLRISRKIHLIKWTSELILIEIETSIYYLSIQLSFHKCLNVLTVGYRRPPCAVSVKSNVTRPEGNKKHPAEMGSP